MTGQPLIEVRAAVKSFGTLAVLRGVDLVVAPGEVMVLIGPSGSGKSTLLRCLNGLERLDSGQVRLDGELLTYDEKSLNRRRQQVGMVFQSFNLFPHMTVRGNVAAAPMYVAGRPRAQAETEAEEMLSKVGLADKADSYPGSLSGGQQQRVAIARALAMGPKLMLFDEPTSALDPELVGEVVSVMRDLAAEGMTMIAVTHEMRFARQAANSVVLLYEGVIAERGHPDQVFDAPTSARGQEFRRQLLQG